MPTTLAAIALVVALGLAVGAVVRLSRRPRIATATQRATYEVLHAAGLAAEPLRAGLTAASAIRAVRHLRPLIGSAGLALFDSQAELALDGQGEHHADQLLAAAQQCIRNGRTGVLTERDLPCDRLDCPVRGAVIVPLTDGTQPTAALAAITDDRPAPGLVQAALETGRWVSAQLALAELE